jgi:hypothetical protein
VISIHCKGRPYQPEAFYTGLRSFYHFYGFWVRPA